MLADTAEGEEGQFNNRLKPYSAKFKFSPSEENKLQEDAEAHRHFQNLFLLFFYLFIFFHFFFFCLHQIEQTYIGTCKVNTLWCFFVIIHIQLDKRLDI